MVWSKYKHAYLAFGTTLLLSFLIWFMGTKGYLAEEHDLDEPEITVITELTAEQFLIKAKTAIYEEKKYLLCNNVTSKLIDHNDYIGQTISQLLDTEYLANEGWQVDILNNDTAVFYQLIEGFCSEHANIRHLTVQDGYVVIMYGPKGFNGGIAQFTDILADVLPGYVKEQLEAGLLEFKSHEEALQALDNFDEYN